MSSNDDAAAAERKRKRLEEWKKRQEKRSSPDSTATATTAASAPAPKVSLKLIAKKKPKTSTTAGSRQLSTAAVVSNPFGDVDDDDDDDSRDGDERGRSKSLLGLGFTLDDDGDDDGTPAAPSSSSSFSDPGETSGRRRKRGRWDAAPTTQSQAIISSSSSVTDVVDALDSFMDKLDAGALGTVVAQKKDPDDHESAAFLSIDVGSSNMRISKQLERAQAVFSLPGGLSNNQVITPEEIANMTSSNPNQKSRQVYTASDWETSGGEEPDTEDEEEEEKARRALVEALKSTPGPLGPNHKSEEEAEGEHFKTPCLAAEVKNEKLRKEQMLRDLEREADEARIQAESSEAPELGRLYNDSEGGIMEEAERNLDAAMAAPDALEVLAEINKKKELKGVDHSKIDYIPIKKNLYIVPKSLANLTNDEVVDLRSKLKIRVRGHHVPAPISSFQMSGLSERVLQVLEKQGITEPFPIQAQCLPCVMAGRDTIGIAKTGSGKSLAFILPMLRHILDQPPLAPSESGPIGLVLAPARELAYQIYLVCKSFTKSLGLKSAAVYGGASVKEQIADLKRGAHIVIATPGRLIDILTMQSGKLLSLQRVSFCVMDEADRMFDMGFAPQISAILGAIRPDRQTLLFSATFPKAVESLARKSLKFPVEVIVGGRSVASDSVTQYAELVEEDDKFLRLLQLLGEHVDETHKAIVFVDTQVHADKMFENLISNGYTCCSLHGGKDQEDRDSTISDFKKRDGPSVLVATGVAGRGLDVPTCSCVINYSCPNHLEAYVHQVGRTGRAGNKGVSYTMVNSTDEAKFAPNIVRALSEAGQSENISEELKRLSESFKEKVQKGEAKWAGSGFKGRGYTYDASEMNEAQKLAQAEKRQALIEAGLLDPDEEEAATGDAIDYGHGGVDSREEEKLAHRSEAEKVLDVQKKLTPELLALPGMKDAILKKAGITREEDRIEDDPTLGRPVKRGDNHWLQEFEIDAYPREARWRVTQKETSARLNDEFRTAVTLKGEYFGPNREPKDGQRRLYLHLESTSENDLKRCVEEIKRILNEETLRVGTKTVGGGGGHKYSVL